MKIPFTKKQYENLLKLVYLGNWVANANRTDDRIEKYEEMESYIFSFAKDFGMERWADYTSPDKTVFPTRWFEEESGVDELYKEEYFNKFYAIRNRYADEFEKYGIGRLKIEEK